MKASRLLFWLSLVAAMVAGTTACSHHANNDASKKPPLQAPKLACTAPAYSFGTAYLAGDEVSNVGHEFQCWKDNEAPLGPGSWAWCSQKPYNPGLPADNGAVHWPDAWKDLGECGGGNEGNRLTLNLELAQPANLTVPRLTSHPATVTGVLRCHGEETPVSGEWGKPLHVDNLKPCNYSLVMNAADGYLPMNSPMMVTFTEDKGEELNQTITYRPPLDLGKLHGLPGIKIEIFAQGLMQPRQMALGNHVLYVGSSYIGSYPGPYADKIYALPLDASGKPTGVHVVASGLIEPNGVAYRNGDLYFATATDLYRVKNIDSTYDHAEPEEVWKFPAGDTHAPLPKPPEVDTLVWLQWHQKHPLHFNPFDPPDPLVYAAVGIPCNICMIPKDPLYGALYGLSDDRKQTKVWARGIRNASDFDWDPITHDIWFDDNNRQGFPNAEEVNHISKQGEYFGVPYVFGRDTLGFTDAEYADPKSANSERWLPDIMILSDIPRDQIDPHKYTPPAYEMASNAAPIGMKFWNGYPSAAGTEHLLVAQHAYGTADDPGLKISMLSIKDSKVIGEIALVDGWLFGANPDLLCLSGCVGRPTYFLELPDKSLLVSDDVAGAIYRVSYNGAGLPDTSLSLQPTAAPVDAVADDMISGYLVSPDGHERVFHVAWGAPALDIKGLPYGEYKIRLNDIKDWVPVTRTTTVALSASNKSPQVDLKYKERPTNVEVTMTVQTPPKPSSVTDPQWKITLKNMQSGELKTLQVPWGGTATETVKYGRYEVLYPYYTQEIPKPTLHEVVVNEESEDFKLDPISYQHSDSLGQSVISETCSGCHNLQFFDDPNKAHNWSNAGEEALAAKIRSMPFAGTHCDEACSGEVSKYLINELWAPYLKPGEAYGKRQLRQLTPDEYANSIKDMFGIDVNQALLPGDKSSKPFKYPGEADVGILHPDDVRLYYNMALSIGGQVNPSSLGVGRNSPHDVVADLGHKVFRRSLTSDEIARYQKVLTEYGPHELVTAMLLSPYFLYRSELGTDAVPGRSAIAVYKLTPDELATALSYTFLGTTPSMELMQKAEQGQLDTPEQIGAEVAQMIRTPRGVEQFQRFIQYYVKTIRGVQEKPGLDENMIKAMTDEQLEFVKHVLLDNKDTVDELFNPGYTFLNEVLAKHYGISGVTGNQMRLVNVADTRGGLLHEGLTQAATSDYETTSLVKRGIMIREQLFCREFGPPVEAQPEEPQLPNRAISTRERWDLVNGEHASGGRCWKCHQFMNDTGASMENYDATGHYRTEEKAYNYEQFPQMVPINAAGPFVDNTGSTDWAHIENVRGIAKHIPGNATALTCLADSYFRFAFGNHSDANSAGAIKAMSDGLKTNGSLRGMLQSLATSHALLYKKEGE